MFACMLDEYILGYCFSVYLLDEFIAIGILVLFVCLLASLICHIMFNNLYLFNIQKLLLYLSNIVCLSTCLRILG
jgi:hypothetical protein